MYRNGQPASGNADDLFVKIQSSGIIFAKIVFFQMFTLGANICFQSFDFSVSNLLGSEFCRHALEYFLAT